ncbi:MAG: putative CDP-diglyceride synthetase/phosphatidate cytidylyltransferase [Alteromonas macleodii]
MPTWAYQLGNLAFAKIKADHSVKDWIHLIPGQGGFGDELDIVIFVG